MSGLRPRSFWPLPALAACLLLAAGAFLWSARSTAPASIPAASPAPDAVAVAAPVPDRAAIPVALGMGAEIGDPLDTSDHLIARTLRAAGLQLLRFGGSYADNYDWENGCSYSDNGRCEPSGAPGHGSALDRFLQFDGQVGARPLIVVNGEIDDPQKAARLVIYYQQHCVRAAGGPRQPGSCVEPYWEVGTSPGYWKHFAVPLDQRQITDASVIQPDQYAALVMTYAAAMRRADPAVRIVADQWIIGATDQGWVADVSAIDTLYAPLLYSPPVGQPTTGIILDTVQRRAGGVDTWLQDLRENLAQFSDSGAIGLIVGRWSIDVNVIGTEPQVYGGYAQALFAAVMLAHFWQDAESGGLNPLLAAVQYPIVGTGQEPFNDSSFAARPAVAVYSLVGQHFGAYPVPVDRGSALRSAGVIAAAAHDSAGRLSVLLVNTGSTRPATVRLQGVPGGTCEVWGIGPAGGASEVSAPAHSILPGPQITLAPWSITVARPGASR